MKKVYINRYIKMKNLEPALFTYSYDVVEETETTITASTETRLISFPKSRLDTGKRFKKPYDGYYFSDSNLAKKHIVYNLYEQDYQLAARLISDLKPYVVDVALGNIEAGTCEEAYHLWGKSVKATLDELVRIFDCLNELGCPPEDFTIERITLWISVLGYTEEDYPTIFVKPVNLFVSDIQLLDKLTGSKEGMTTKEYDEKRRYVLRKVLTNALG